MPVLLRRSAQVAIASIANNARRPWSTLAAVIPDPAQKACLLLTIVTTERLLLDGLPATAPEKLRTMLRESLVAKTAAEILWRADQRQGVNPSIDRCVSFFDLLTVSASPGPKPQPGFPAFWTQHLLLLTNSAPAMASSLCNLGASQLASTVDHVAALLCVVVARVSFGLPVSLLAVACKWIVGLLRSSPPRAWQVAITTVLAATSAPTPNDQASSVRVISLAHSWLSRKDIEATHGVAAPQLVTATLLWFSVLAAVALTVGAAVSPSSSAELADAVERLRDLMLDHIVFHASSLAAIQSESGSRGRDRSRLAVDPPSSHALMPFMPLSFVPLRRLHQFAFIDASVHGSAILDLLWSADALRDRYVESRVAADLPKGTITRSSPNILDVRAATADVLSRRRGGRRRGIVASTTTVQHLHIVSGYRTPWASWTQHAAMTAALYFKHGSLAQVTAMLTISRLNRLLNAAASAGAGAVTGASPLGDAPSSSGPTNEVVLLSALSSLMAGGEFASYLTYCLSRPPASITAITSGGPHIPAPGHELVMYDVHAIFGLFLALVHVSLMIHDDSTLLTLFDSPFIHSHATLPLPRGPHGEKLASVSIENCIGVWAASSPSWLLFVFQLCHRWLLLPTVMRATKGATASDTDAFVHDPCGSLQGAAAILRHLVDRAPRLLHLWRAQRQSLPFSGSFNGVGIPAHSSPSSPMSVRDTISRTLLLCPIADDTTATVQFWFRGPHDKDPPPRQLSTEAILQKVLSPLSADALILQQAKGDAGARATLTAAFNDPMFTSLIRDLPHVVPMVVRLELFRRVLLTQCRLREGDDSPGNEGHMPTRLKMKVRRTHCLDDSMARLAAIAASTDGVGGTGGGGAAAGGGGSGLGRIRAALKYKFFVQFVDADGQMEAGIDGGGLFKEYLELVMKQVVDPARGLFTTVGAAEGHTGGTLSPNPCAVAIVGSAAAASEAYRFLGRMMGKALLEGIVIPFCYSRNFLANLLGRGCSLEDLQFLDPDQYRSLNSLKSMNPEDVAELELFMCAEESIFGGSSHMQVTDLEPNGRNILVTGDNCIRYVHRMAHHRLTASIQFATQQCLLGLEDVIQMSWLQMFSVSEFARLLHGQTDGGRGGFSDVSDDGDVTAGFDVADLRANVTFVGGYNAKSRTIELLWEVLSEMSAADRGSFLKFCTGSSRPPLFGFAAMNPPFSIRRAEDEQGGRGFLNYVMDIDRLPSAATCFNLLKLPPYKNKSNIRDKLLAAIRCDSGFQLS